MNDWHVAVMTKEGLWCYWTTEGWQSRRGGKLALKKEEAVEMAKRVFSNLGWAYGVKITHYTEAPDSPNELKSATGGADATIGGQP